MHTLCGQGVGAQPLKIRVDPAAAVSATASSLLEEVSYIPLETTPQSQFSDVLQLTIGSRYIVVLDQQVSAILIFTRTGKFHQRINISGPVFQFFLDDKKDQLSFDIYPSTLVYDVDGKLIHKTTAGGVPHGQFGVSKMKLNNNTTVYYNTTVKLPGDSSIDELLFYKGDSLVNKCLPFPGAYKMDELDAFGFKNFIPNVTNGDTAVYYIRNYDYTVYRIHTNRISPAYQFIFPLQDALPDGFRETTINRMEYVAKGKDLITRLFAFHRVKDLLNFDDGHGSYLYSLSTRRLFDLDQVHADSLTYDLPISGERMTLEYDDGKYFYSFCQPDILFNKMAATDKSRRMYPAALQQFFQNKKNAVGNPVLIVLRFKSNL
jgi:6-bladed beta-propeller